MIRVLQDWGEVGDAYLDLTRAGLPLHETPQKNWDHGLLRRLLDSGPRSAGIVDLGCGAGLTLGFLHSLGFRDLTGIDLRIEPRLRLKTWVRMARRRQLRSPWRILRRDITRTNLPAQSMDAAVSVSVIEHGVPMPAFFAECARILRPGGKLFVTTDYWEILPSTVPSGEPYGLPWRPFCRESLQILLAQAEEAGFELCEPGRIPECKAATVHWQQTDYTFAAMAWQRRSADGSAQGTLLR